MPSWKDDSALEMLAEMPEHLLAEGLHALGLTLRLPDDPEARLRALVEALALTSDPAARVRQLRRWIDSRFPRMADGFGADEGADGGGDELLESMPFDGAGDGDFLGGGPSRGPSRGVRATGGGGARPRAEAQDPVADGPRHLQAAVEERASGAPRVRTLRAGRPHRLHLWIGPPSSDILAPLALDEAAIAFTDGHAEVELLFEVLGGGGPTRIQRRVLDLPARGASNRAELTVTPEGPELRASVTLTHKRRVLETWTLVARVVDGDDPDAGPAIALTDPRPAHTPRHLDARTPFHANLLERDGGLTADTGTDARRLDLRIDGLEQLLRQIDDALAGLPASSAAASFGRGYAPVLDPSAPAGTDWSNPLESPATFATLRTLALAGHELYARLVERAPEIAAQLDRAERIQVMSAVAGRVLPLEICYDREPPTRTARLCPHARAALATGRCTCVPSEDFLCPLGFWGLSKVLERQVVPQGDYGAADFVIGAGAADGALRIAPPIDALLAGSHRVDAVQPGALAAVEAALARLAQVRRSRHRVATSWAEHKAAVADLGPRLIVLLPHTESDPPVLEIGHDPLDVGNLVERHVRRDAGDRTFVVLLGCETTVQRGAFEQIVPRFLRHGAAVVISTLSRIRGRHAAPLAEGLIAHLQEDGPPLGELMRTWRLGMFARGYPTALGVVAFGDADVRLG